MRYHLVLAAGRPSQGSRWRVRVARVLIGGRRRCATVSIAAHHTSAASSACGESQTGCHAIVAAAGGRCQLDASDFPARKKQRRTWLRGQDLALAIVPAAAGGAASSSSIIMEMAAAHAALRAPRGVAAGLMAASVVR